MRGKRRTGVGLAVIICLCTMLLAGCGRSGEPEKVTVPTISVSDKGVVTGYLVEDFKNKPNEKRYDITELSAMVQGEADQYNSVHGTEGETAPVVVESVEINEENGIKAVIAMRYSSTQVYEDYNGKALFYGTVEQAVEAGYPVDVELKSVKDQSSVALSDNKEKHVLIVEEKVNIRSPKKILAIGGGGALNENGTVDASQEEGMTYILMK